MTTGSDVRGLQAGSGASDLGTLGGRKPATREPPVPRDEDRRDQWAAKAHFRLRLVEVVTYPVVGGQACHNGFLGTRTDNTS